MEVSFSQRVKERFPLVEIASIIIGGVDNTGGQALKEEREKVKRVLKGEYRTPGSMGTVRAYKKYFDKFQVQFPVERGVKAILEGKDIPSASPLVDAMLLAELKSGILLGIQDLDRIEGNVVVDEAYEGEEFVRIDGERISLRQGDIVLRDSKSVIGSYFEGQSEKTKVHRDTKKAVIFGLPVPGIDKVHMEAAMRDAVKNVLAACKGKQSVLEFHNPNVSKVVTEELGLERLDPWGRANIKDYSRLLTQFGIEPFEKMAGQIPDPHNMMKRGIIFGHRDFGRILDAIKKKKPWVMMTGLMPSGKFHLGHKMLVDQIVYYQKLGAELFVCVADLEAYCVRKMDMEELRKIAIEEYLLNYIALGLKPERCHFYFQSDWKAPYYRLSAQLSRRVTFNEFKDIYGEITPGKMQAVLLQVSDILHPQLKEFGGPRPVLVPVGVDQDPHLRLTRDLAERSEFGFIAPSSTYHRFMTGLRGGKMSSSVPESYIALTDKPDVAAKKVLSAITGGGGSVKEHREKGGNPNICAVYEMYAYHLTDSEKYLKRVHDECRSGSRICGDCKKECAELLKKFLTEHQKKMTAARKDVNKFLKK